MLYVTYLLNSLLMITMSLLLGWFLARRLGQPWRFFIVGGVTFILAQVFHIPLVAGLTLAFRQGLLPAPPPQWQSLFNAVLLGLLAGLTEELARYFVLKYSLKDARSWPSALMFGAGHGGFEAIILGIVTLIAYVNMVMLAENPTALSTLPADQLAVAQAQVAAYWSAPWPMPLLGALERAFALCIQLSLSVLVMQVFLRKQILWLVLAILWHTLVDAVAVLALPQLGPAGTEVVVGVAALISLGIIFALRTPDDSAPTATPELPAPSAS